MSILGVFLFNATIDDIEDGCQDLVDTAITDQDREELDSSDDPSKDELSLLRGNHTSMPTWPGRADGPCMDDSPIRRLYEKRKRKRRKIPALELTIEGHQTVPDEPNDRTEARWIHTLPTLRQFIDDGFTLSKINFKNSYGFEVNGFRYGSKHAVQAQNVFRHMVKNAERLGMKVNASKTDMICVSDSLSFEAEAYILDSDGNRIGCSKSIRALGLHFSSKPNMDAQVAHIQRSVRGRFWILRNLKKNSFTQDELVRVYISMIRPVLDYGSVVYHSALTDEQDYALECLQTHALKCIFGPRISARKMRSMAGITTLRDRRVKQCDKFSGKLSKDPRFESWFLRKMTRRSGRSTRAPNNNEIYLETKARCNRLHNSPMFFFRR